MYILVLNMHVLKFYLFLGGVGGRAELVIYIWKQGLAIIFAWCIPMYVVLPNSYFCLLSRGVMLCGFNVPVLFKL